MTLDELNRMDRDSFVAALGAIFEHSPWVPDGAFAARPFASIDALHAAMVDVVSASGEDAQLGLLRAHPDLAGKAARAGALTDHSTREQAGAGLDRLSDAEFDRFHRQNDAYQSGFGFPFIIAVKGHTKESILAAFDTRLGNDRAAEMREALRNVAMIGRFRLDDLIAD